MPRVRRALTVGAPQEAVWRLVSDPYALPRWWPQVVRVEDVNEDGWTNVLSTPRGKIVRADFTRTAIEAPRHLAWRQELLESPFERVFSAAETELTLAGEGEGTTRVELSAHERLRGRFRLGGFMVRRAARRRLDDALAGLRGALEAE